MKSIIFFAAFNLYSLFAFSQIRLDLEQAYVLLESQNLELVQERLVQELSRQDLLDARNAFLPTVNLGLSNQYNSGLSFDQISGQLITGSNWTSVANGNLALRASIFQGFSKINGLKLAELNLQSKDLEYDIKRQTLRLDLLSNYFKALVNNELSKVAEAQLGLSKEQLRVIKTEVEVGVKTLVDLNYVENIVANDELKILISKTNFANDILSLKRVLNFTFSDSLILEIPSFAVIENLDTSELSVENNRYIALSELNVRRNELLVKTKKNSFYPSIMFSGGYGSNYSSERYDNTSDKQRIPFFSQVNQNRSLNIGLSLSMPVFDAFKARGDIRRSKINLQIAQVEVERVKKEQEIILQRAIQDYVRTVKEYGAYNKQFVSSKTAYDATVQRYEIGMASPFELATAQVSFNVSELNYVKSRYDVLYRQEVIKILEN